ncbi:MAG: CPBP family intramembrane metalloprotease [Cycloclasticus sp.]|nr:CPBP family intramembrane metalloprotease [Cycloclasticus sp.]
MKAPVFFILYFLAASLLAALIAYPLFQMVGNETYRFESWVTRGALLFLVLGIIPCFKLFDLSMLSIGYNKPFGLTLKQISIGFIFGLLILSVVISMLFFLEIRVIDAGKALTSSILLKALLAGLLIALIEETLFRGLFFKLAELWHNSFSAVVISSFFYAILHFIKPFKHIDQSALTFSSGFDVIINAFYGLGNAQLDDFLALFSVGILLALVRLKTNSLTFCIGLHASWVLLIKLYKELSDDNKLSNWTFLTGQYDGIIGWLSFSWLTWLVIIYVIYVIKPLNKSIA